MFVNFSVMPLRVSTITGFVLSGIGAVGGAMVLAEALTSSPPPCWASLMGVVLLLSGVQLVILGIIGEYLGRLYLTANGRPQSVIREVRPNDSARAAVSRAPARLRESAET